MNTTKRWQAVKAGVALSALMILSNCAGSSDVGTPTLQINIPSTCEQLLQPVADPLESAKVADSALSLLAKYKQKLGLANGRIVQGRTCFQSVRARFGAGK